jgi:hypothetical protein
VRDQAVPVAPLGEVPEQEVGLDLGLAAGEEPAIQLAGLGQAEPVPSS